MTSTVFTDNVTPVPAAWLNDVNKTTYTSSEYYADAGGTSDALTASYTTLTADAALYDGFRVTVGITTPNTTTTPTLAVTLNGSAQPARTIVKFVGNVEVALAIGDLQGDADLRYDLPNTKWVLQNPSVSVDLAPIIHAATSKTTPVGADEMGIWDSVSGLLNKVSFTNALNWFAALAGSASQVFSIAPATATTHATAYSQLSDGWVSDFNTWTYASASTFTISGDQTAIYTKGTKLKWTQTTAKYGYVASSSFGGGNTTVTIIVNADYTIANAAITVPKFSRADKPVGFPAQFTFTTTMTGTTVGQGSIYFTLQGGLCVVNTSTGGAFTSNAASFTMTMPINCATTYAGNINIGGMVVCDNGSWQTVPGVAGIGNASNILYFGKTQATVSGNSYAGFTASGAKSCDGIVSYPY